VLLVEAALASDPAPLITPDNVWSVEEAAVKLAPLAMLTAPAYAPEPNVPVPLIISVPALIVVLPVYVFVAVRVSVLLVEIDLVIEPAPLITPDKV
jgi:hypothetical protein